MIKKVQLENWKSHHETEIDFSSGVNTLIGTMGSGKSSVLEAIVFALYGTTPALNSREVKLDDVIRRSPSEAMEAKVKIWLRIEEDEYTVEREIERNNGTKRSELRKNGDLIEAPSTKEVTEQVEKLLDMDFHSFSRAVFSEQNNLDLFLEMRPGDRKERIDELLKLDRFEDARQTTVKVENRLKDQISSKQDELSEIEDEVDKEEVEELRGELEEIEKKQGKLRKKVEGFKEKIQKKTEKQKKLKEKEKQSQKLKERKTRLETRKESIEERLEDKEEIDFENLETRKEEVEKQIEQLNERKEKIQELEKKLEFREDKLEDLEERQERLVEEAEKFQKLENIDERLEKIREKIESVKEDGAGLHAERQNLTDSVKTLNETHGDCPTCGQELDDKHREELFKERKNQIKQLKKEEKKLRQDLEDFEEKREKLEEKRDQIMQYQESEEKLEELNKQIEQKKDNLEETKQKLQDHREEWSKGKTDKLEQELEKLEEAEKIMELKEKKQALKQKLEKTVEKLEALDFSQQKLEKTQKKLSELKEERSVKKKTFESRQELLKEKKKRLEQMEKRIEKMDKLEEELEQTDRILDFVHEYKLALEDTQITMRQRFVQRLNELMDGIWSQVYPYDDYYSIKLNAEEGYLLELLDSENNWISAEAEVSGGERHSAALVMRLALTFTLSPKLQVLILDEPTHNLDSSAVEELAETLRERTSELINQLFVVTHDPALESSATGKLYQFDKKGTETGLTEVEEVK